jgi:hypothetical protein
MKFKGVLLVDASINLFLGIILLIYSKGLVKFFGLPQVVSRFYPNILGGVFIGITIALVVEHFRRESGIVGLGLGGALIINLCGGFTLFFWLISGNLSIPITGKIILWILFSVLVIISGLELVFHLFKNRLS